MIATVSSRGNALIVTNALLVVVGAVLLVLYRIGLHSQGVTDIVWFIKLALVQAALYLIAAWLIVRARGARSTLLLVLLFAGIFRLSIVFAPPYLSDDIYRYVWDGRVQAAGINPYRYIPADDHLKSLRDEKIYPKINRRDYAHTMYPPAAEAIYFLTTRISESVTWMKLTIVGFELIAIWILMELLASFGMPRQYILIYAWHPLAVWEFAGSGHVDPLAFAFIALALLARRRNRETTTGVALGLATLAKLFPIVLFPALYKRWGWKMPLALVVTIVAGYLPYLGVGPGVIGFIPGYAQERGIVSGEQFFILGLVDRVLGFKLPNAVFLSFAGAALLALALWSIPKRDDNDSGCYLKRSLVLGTAFNVLFAPHFPWYFAWLILFLCFVRSIPVFYLTVASFVLYGTWIAYKPESVFALKGVLYIPWALIGAIAFLNRKRSQGRVSVKTLSRATETVANHREVTCNKVQTPSESSKLPDSERANLGVTVVIAALNEEETVGQVVSAVPRDLVSEIIVVDNGSEDLTAEKARSAGARVIIENRRGYGSAFRAGVKALDPNCKIIVFLDGDGSDAPEQMGVLIRPILDGTHDFVLGSRILGRREPGSMIFHQVFAGYLIGFLMRVLYGVHYTDMGPFRAIRRDALERLGMREETYGWPLEMQMRAARANLRILEVPIDYRQRAGGSSKISGTLKGSILAATRILLTLSRIAMERR